MAGELLSDQKDLNNHSEAQNPDYLATKRKIDAKGCYIGQHVFLHKTVVSCVFK